MVSRPLRIHSKFLSYEEKTTAAPTKRSNSCCLVGSVFKILPTKDSKPCILVESPLKRLPTKDSKPCNLVESTLKRLHLPAKPPQQEVQTTPEVSQPGANYPRGLLDKLSLRITGRSRSAAPAASTHRMKSGMTVDKNHTDISSTKPIPTSLDTTKLNMK